MNIKIVADSSANLFTMDGISYASVPLKLVTETQEYVDDAALDTAAMMADLAAYKGRSGSSCPNVGDWLDAFGDAQYIFTLAITQNLSGSHNAARQAKEVYEEQYPDRKVCCLDTLTTGPELVLLAEKLRELAAQDLEDSGADRGLYGQDPSGIYAVLCRQSGKEWAGPRSDRQGCGTAQHPHCGQGQRFRHLSAGTQVPGREKGH